MHIQPLIATVLLTLGAVSAAQADKCKEREHKNHPVEMATCSYDNGSSGYTRIKNTGNRAADVCWTVVFNDGRQDKGCYTNMPAGKTSEASCFSCGSKNGGAESIRINKYKPVG